MNTKRSKQINDKKRMTKHCYQPNKNWENCIIPARIFKKKKTKVAAT